MTAKDLKLDYFKLYEVENRRIHDRATLMGQFDKEPAFVELLALGRFANPVSKKEEPLYNPQGHLTVYRIHQTLVEPARSVVIENQFGKQELVIGNTAALLAPARKYVRGSEEPKGLDHFKAYQVLEGKPIGKTFPLKDQFGAGEATIGMPVAFAVPVKKEHLGKAYAIQNEKAHLVIYAIAPRALSKNFQVRDEFNAWTLLAVRAVSIAAPSLKLEWKVL
jgi:hypothetical protein